MTKKSEGALGEFTPPSVSTLGLLLSVHRLWHRPWMTGLENIDASRPTLFVGNHTIYGMLDVPLLGYEVYNRKGIYIRGLADRAHFRIPGWRSIFKRMGSVVGSRENCSALMESGAHIMVFPGGSREVAKRKGEAYQLIWKDRTGFARMAVAHGYRIIPFAAVGAEECYDVLLDSKEIMDSSLVQWLKTTRLGAMLGEGEQLFPLSRGLGPTAIPRPERFYFSFGQPMETAPFKGQSDDPAVLAKVRDAVKASIEAQVLALQKVQSKDPHRGLITSLLGGQEPVAVELSRDPARRTTQAKSKTPALAKTVVKPTRKKPTNQAT